jgi:hypothetical protein
MVGTASEQPLPPGEFAPIVIESPLDGGSQSLPSPLSQPPPSLPDRHPMCGASAKPPPLPNNLGKKSGESGVKTEAAILSFDEIRTAYIRREAVVRAWGWGVFTVAVLFGCVALFAFLLQVLVGVPGSEWEGIWSVGLFALGCGAGVGTVSYGLLKLRRWCKWLIIIVACALVWSTHPIALAVGLVIIFSLCDRKTSMVFSNQYKTAIKNTPHIKYHPSKGVTLTKPSQKVVPSSRAM